MGIYNREHFDDVNEASMYYISLMDKLTRELFDAVSQQDSQLIIQIGNLFIEVSNKLKETHLEAINIQQEKIKEIMRPHLS